MIWILVISTALAQFQPIIFKSQEDCTTAALYLIEEQDRALIKQPETIFGCYKIEEVAPIQKFRGDDNKGKDNKEGRRA